uniref:Uncharacterized protein n=1 Tax=Lepeophtheirus salmonis TaxID=72036 RepID=A0A0K2TN35_LEPSM
MTKYFFIEKDLSPIYVDKRKINKHDCVFCLKNNKMILAFAKYCWIYIKIIVITQMKNSTERKVKLLKRLYYLR